MKNKALLAVIIGLCVVLAAGLIWYFTNGGTPSDADIETEDVEEEELMDDELTDEELADEEWDDEDYEDEEDYPDYSPESDEVITLEEALVALQKQEGYNKNADGAYQITETVDGIKSTRIVSAKENHIDVDLTYEYSKDETEEMIKFFKANDDDVVYIMVSSFLTRLAEYANAEKGDMSFVIKVGGQQVQKGKMTLAQARKYQEKAME